MRKLIASLVAVSAAATAFFCWSNAPSFANESHQVPMDAAVVNPCGTCSALGADVAVGADFFWGEFDSEAAADTALDVVANRDAMRDAFFESLTWWWLCPGCIGGTGCNKYWQTNAEFGGGVALDKPAGVWRMYIECTTAGTVWPCCTACVQ